MKKMVKSVMIVLFLVQIMCTGVFASTEKFELIPEAKDGWQPDVKELTDVEKQADFSATYNDKARQYLDDPDSKWLKCKWIWEQFASGIMNRDTIMCLSAQAVRFISNMAMVVWALMIIYAGYIYGMSVFSPSTFGVQKWHDAIKYAITGIVVVILSYALINFVIEAVL